MSSFCRITGHTRGLPKTNHFFPILPPISPAEAKKYRTTSCRITSNFNPAHNYIPIKNYLDSAHVTKCPITRNSLFKYKHFQFIAPVVTSKSGNKFFYVLDSKVLLLPDEIEMQLSKGIITDVQISNHTIGFKYNYKVKEYDLDVLSEVSEDNLIFGKRFDCEVLPGAGIKVLKKRKVGGKRRGSIAQLTSVFEEKEKKAELDQIKSVEKICPDEEKVKGVKGKLDEVMKKSEQDSKMTNQVEKISPDVDKVRIVQGKMEEMVMRRRRSAGASLQVPDVLYENMDEDVMMDYEPDTVAITLSSNVTDQVVPAGPPGPPRFILQDGTTVDKVTDQNSRFIKGTVTGNVVQHGKVINGEFTPGQIIRVPSVVEENAEEEKFIPGVMVDNHFTPGQIVEVSPGIRKFVPGQVMDIQGTRKFVPGQIVIEEGDEGGTHQGGGAVPAPTYASAQGAGAQASSFKFVPGRITETQEGSFEFHPGEMVETGEGLKFVCDNMYEHDFELQTFEMEHPILFDVEDVRRVVETASSVPVEFEACCNVIFEQAVFEKRVDERVITNAKEWVKAEERKILSEDHLAEAINFARGLGNEGVAAELEGVLHGDEELRARVLGDPGVRFIIIQLLVLKGMVDGTSGHGSENQQSQHMEDGGSSSDEENRKDYFDKAVFKSNVIAKVLLDEGPGAGERVGAGPSAPGGGSNKGGRGRVGSSGSGGSFDQRGERASSVGSGGSGQGTQATGGGVSVMEVDEVLSTATSVCQVADRASVEKMDEQTHRASHEEHHDEEQVSGSSKRVVTTRTSKQSYCSVSVEEHEGSVIQFQSVHTFSTDVSADGVQGNKRQRLGGEDVCMEEDHDHQVLKQLSLDLDSIPPESVELLDTTPAKHKLSLARQLRKKSGGGTQAQGHQLTTGGDKRTKIVLKSGEELLHDTTLVLKNERDLILYELIETEEEFVRDLEFVMGTYYKEIYGSPKFGKYRDVIFDDFKAIHSFHKNSLVEAIRYYTDDPCMIAKSFLRLERDFEPHVRFHQDHLKIEELISNDLDLLEFIEDLSVSAEIRDSKRLTDHLKLPLQRINDYVLIFKDLLDVCSKIHDDPVEREVLQRVLELLVAIPQKLDDRKFLNSIEGIDAGVLGKLGRLLGHDWFVVTEHAPTQPSGNQDPAVLLDDGSPKNRYVFLFKHKLLVTKVKRISEQRSVFVLKQALHIPDYFVEPLGPKSFRLVGDLLTVEFDASGNNSGEQGSGAGGAADYWVHEVGRYGKREGQDNRQNQVVAEQEAAASSGTLKREAASSETAAGGASGVIVKKSKSGGGLAGVGVELLHVPYEEESCTSSSDNHTLREDGVAVVAKPGEKAPQEKAHTHEKAQKQGVEVGAGGKPEVPGSQPTESSQQQRVGSGGEAKLPDTGTSVPEIKSIEGAEAGASKETISGAVPQQQQDSKTGEVKDSRSGLSVGQKKEPAAESSPQAQKKDGAVPQAPGCTQQQAVAAPEEPASPHQKPKDSEGGQKWAEGGVSKRESIGESGRKDQQERGSASTSLQRQGSLKPKAEETKSEKSTKCTEPKSAGASKKPPLPGSPERKKSVPEAPVPEAMEEDGDATPPPSKLLTRRRSSVIMARQLSESSNLKIQEPMQSAECEPGENAIFKLKVSSPSTIITWLKGNRPLDDKYADRVRIESRGNAHSLTMMNCREEDAALYTAKVCELIGKEGGISEPVSCSAYLVVHEMSPEERANKAERDSPHFLVKFKDTELLRHTTVNFLFLITGNPDPDVLFKRNDVKLTNEEDRVSITRVGLGKYELRIEKIEDSDAGTFTVVASNKHGITEVNAVVRVVDEKDVFNEGMAMRPGDAEGNAAERKGLLQPGEEPIFTWFKDGKAFEPGEDFKVLFKDEEDTLALVFQHVKPEDAGLYTCVAATSSGRISCSAELTVQGGINQLLKEPLPPVITAKLTDTEVSVGGSAMLELKVTGFPKPTIQWFKDKDNQLEAGGRIRFLYEDDESIALIIKNVAFEDEGLYKVVATNDLGEASTEGKLLVRQPPRFIKKMTDHEMMAEQAFTIDVEVEANPKPELKWYKDGVLIVSSERIKFVASADGMKYSMRIERVTLEDTGAYSVVASNAVGQMSEFWNVLATLPARFVERLPSNEVREKGDKGGEYVVKVAGVPDPKVQFKFDGKEIKFEKLEHQVYKVVVPELTQGKDYELVATATNQFAKDESACVFNVKRGVKIVEGLKDIIVKEHGEAEVGVKVDCFPKPKSVKWFIDGVEIGGKAYEQKVDDGGRYSLVVKDAYKPDGCRMDVKVVVDNGLGEDSSSATITMQAPPVIKKGLNPLYRLENSTTQELTVTLRETTPTPSGTWFHNGKEVTADARIKISKKSTETYTLTFDAVKYEDAGEWAFKAVNDIGEVWTRTTVIVEGKPQITSPLPGSMRILETETYDLEVNILDYCEENVKIEWKSDVETVFKPIVAGARDGDAYHSKVTFVPSRKERYFKVVATNKYGETESICQIDWIELVPPKIMTPLNESYTIQDGDPFHFASEVEGIPKPRVVWLHNGEVLQENVTSIDGTVEKATVGEYTLHAVNVAGEAVSKTKLQMLQTPPTLSNLDDTYKFKETEEDLVLSVDISGSPIPTVTWLHDGSPIDLNDPRVSVTTTPTKSTLVVKNAAKEDKGAYSVQVTNGNGAVQGRASVDITFAPIIDGKLTYPELVIQKTRFEIKGHVSGEPFPEITWVHPTGKVISESEPGVYEVKVYQDGSVILAIESAQMTDGGIYKLVAKNERGEASLQSGIVNVEAPRTRPRINPPLPAQIRLIEGQPLTLRTTVKAHPIPELALLFDDSPVPYEQRTIENGLDFEHKLKAVTSSGTYVLRATNSEGSTESECKLLVISKMKEGALAGPSFAQELMDKKNVNEGTELVLIAKVDGNPIPDVIVLKDGKVIDPGELLEFDGTCVKFRLPETSMADAGEYELKVVNGSGEASSKCQVTVNKVFKAPEFMQKFTDQAQMPTRDCKFGGKVSGFPAPEVKWLKDGQELDLSNVGKYKVRAEDDIVSLQVRNCDDSDIGVYTCELTNVEGKAVCNAKLDVVEDLPPQLAKSEAPYFLKTIGSTEVYPGMQSKFTACIGGFPEPEFEWFRDGTRIHEANVPGTRVQFIRDGIGAGLIKLVVNDTNVGDIGEYRLRIYNEHGEASCTATLKFDTFDPRGSRKEQSPLGDYYMGYSDLRPTALPDRSVITRMDDKSLTLNWKAALPNVHSKFPCTYVLEMAPADGNEWKTVYSGLKNCHADVDFPSQSLDYKFRVRVQWGEKYVSEPSPYVITNSPVASMERNKLNLAPVHWQPIVVPSIPRSYDLTRPPHPEYTHAPRFLNPEQEIQYAARGTPATVHFSVYGYPKPTISFRFNGQPTSLTHTYTDNGLISLFLNEMNDGKVGVYECIATNPHGVATQAVNLRLCEHPWFLEHLRETHVCARKNGKLHCIVHGIPSPSIRLFKDWHVCGKQFQVVQVDEHTVSVTVLFEDTLLRDEGLYSIVATNHAGSAHSSAMVRIYEDEGAYGWASYGVRPRVLRLRKSDPNDYYHFGEVIGRGTQGVHYHVVETRTGAAWAAKRMVINNEANSLHRHMIETEIENWANVNSPHVVRLYDGFFDNRTFVLVNELCNGGDLFGHLIYELEDFDEGVVRRFLYQIASGLRDLHEQKLWVCGLQPLDLLLTHKRSTHVKLTDFGMSRYGDPTPHRYSHPEFASPELVSGLPISGKSDMWSYGIIAYILLTGHHPYLGLNDQETMENLKNWSGGINEAHVAKLSPQARDFLITLLRINPGDRPSAEALLTHEWFMLQNVQVEAKDRVNLFNEGHVKYYNHLRAWQSNANCTEVFRRNPLETAYKHPTKMVYPPGYDWVEEREYKVVTRSDWDLPRPYVEIDEFVSESHYTSGDDTYLLQLRDTDFPARLRQYMKVAASQSPSFALHLQGSYYDRNVPIIRERRKFTDIMDEEVDDERRARIVEYGEGPINSEPRRLRHEVGTRLDIQAEADAIIAMKREGREPCFRERPASTVYVKEFGGDLDVSVLADGEPHAPDVQWFKNDTLLQSNDPVHRHRLEVTSESENTVNRSHLLIHNVKNTDLTGYKVTARNKQGQMTWKFRISMLPDEKVMPRALPSPNYSVEKSPTPLSTEAHAFESVSTPEVIVKGAFTSVLRSGSEQVFRVCSTEEYELCKNLVSNHVLGGEYEQAIQVGSGVAMKYCSCGGAVMLPLLEHFVGLGEYTEQNVVGVMEQLLHGLSYLHWAGIACIGLGPASVAVEQGSGVVRIVDLSGGQRVSRVGVASELVSGRLNGRLNLERDIEFVAPEALSTVDSQVTGQADVWSVGVLIYLLLSGHSPFKGATEDETKQNIMFVQFRFEHLYKDLTQEATRLIMLIFKRSPLKRPSAEECFEHRWFHPTDSLVRKRSRVPFRVDKLQDYLGDLYEDEERSSTCPDHSNALLADFYRAHNLA